MHYKAPDNSLHCLDDDSFAHLLPAGSVAITDEEAEALRPKPDADAIIEAKKAAIRTVREGILNRLAGIALAAGLAGDDATTAAYLIVRKDLLDITTDLPADPAEIDGAVVQRYQALVVKCTPAMAGAFNEVDA